MKNKKPTAKERKFEFSKILLIQESILIWIMTISCIVLAFICVLNQYLGEIPWLTAMVALPWAAYAVSQKAYYDKARAENTKNGIKYESVICKGQTTEDDTPVG